MTNPAKKVALTIEFDNQEALRQFAVWLCESGEQDYWEWMRYREEEQDGSITATAFDYHQKQRLSSGETKYGEFVADNTIRTECGRLSPYEARREELLTAELCREEAEDY